MHLDEGILREIVQGSATLFEKYGAKILDGKLNLSLPPDLVYKWERALSTDGKVPYSDRIRSLRPLSWILEEATSGFARELETSSGWSGFIRKALNNWHVESVSGTVRNINPYAPAVEPFTAAILEELNTLDRFNSGISAACKEEIRQNASGILHGLSELVFFEYHQSHFSDSGVSEFIDVLNKRGYADFFREFPVSARLIGETSLAQIFSYDLLLKRVFADLDVLTREFGEKNIELPLTSIGEGFSVAHNPEGPVRKVRFASGFELFYKPRPGAGDLLYNAICYWVNQKMEKEWLKPVATIDRGDYCWQGVIEYRPLNTSEDAQYYYYRSGLLLGLRYVLGADDYHLDNVIASGEYPVLIDNETIISHLFSTRSDGDSERGGLNISKMIAEANGDGDNAGISAIHGDQYALPYRTTGINDHGEVEIRDHSVLRKGKNKPYFKGNTIEPDRYVQVIIAGCRDMIAIIGGNAYEFEHLIAAETKHFTMPHRSVLRDSRWYWAIREELRQPEYMRSGVERSIALEKLVRPLANNIDAARITALLQHEIDSLQKMYIPSIYLDEQSILNWDQGSFKLIRQTAQTRFKFNINSASILSQRSNPF